MLNASRLVQFSKAYSPMEVRVAGTVPTEVRLVQLLNAYCSMVFSEEGRLMSVRALQ